MREEIYCASGPDIVFWLTIIASALIAIAVIRFVLFFEERVAKRYEAHYWKIKLGDAQARHDEAHRAPKT